MKALAAIFLLVIVPSALATHPSEHRSQRTNLDHDRMLEMLVGTEDVSSDHSYWRASVRIVDRCRGRNRTHVVVGGYRRLETASAVQADGRGPNEAIGVLTDVPSAGTARLVRMVDRRGHCPTLRALFRYVAAATTPPTRDLTLERFEVRMHQFELETPERELSLSEYFRAGDGSLAHRVTLYRYVRAQDRYRPYASVTHGP